MHFSSSEIADGKKVGVKVLTMPPEVPFGLALARSINETFVSSADAGRILKVNPLIFGRITSALSFVQDLLRSSGQEHQSERVPE